MARARFDVRRWVALLWPLLAVAADAQVVVEAHAGFGGVLRLGRPNPITVRIANHGATAVTGVISVIDEGIFSFGGAMVERRFEVSPGVSRQVTMLILGVADTQPAVVLETDEPQNFRAETAAGLIKQRGRSFSVTLDRADPAFQPNAVLILGGRARQLRGALVDAWAPDEETRSVYRLYGEQPVDLLALSEDLAPDTWIAYQGLAGVLWTEPDLASMPNPAQLRALQQYVEFGGELTVLSASRPSLLDAEAMRRLLGLSGVAVDQREYPVIGEVGDGLMGPWLDLTFRAEPSAQTGPNREGLPPSLGRRIGNGRLLVAAFDPLRYDLGDPRVLARAVAYASDLDLRYAEDVQRDVANPLVQGPFADSAAFAEVTSMGRGELFYTALKNENVITPSLGLFFVLALGFVLLIGPIDYKLLKSIGKLYWSPFTLLVYTALFAGISVGATFLMFAPNEQVNRIAILDFTEDDDGKESFSGWIYHGVYAPYGGEYLPVPGDHDSFGVLVTHAEGKAAGMADFGRSARVRHAFLGPGAQPLALRLPFNALRVTTHRVAGRPSGGLTAVARRVDGDEVVTVHNGLSVALHHVALVTGDRKIKVQDLAPGETAQVPVKNAVKVQVGEESWWSQSSVRRDGDTEPPGILFGHILRASFEGSEHGPWQLPHPSGLMLFAVAEDLPYDDGVADDARGFTWVFVRKRVLGGD